jgi:galactose-3-O-sulfotransferase
MALPAYTVIFLHIPRTGGTTLKKIPDRNYGRDQTLTFYDSARLEEVERFAKLPESERAKYKFIKGHLHFGFHRLVPGKSAYVTFLREPISRALSFYSYARTRPDHYLYRLLNEEGLSLKGLLQREATVELFNLQTRLIGGDENNPGCSVDRSVLDRAKENLRTHFCLVGLMEAFDASLLLLTRMLGWGFPFYVKRNASWEERHADTIGAQTSALLREANALDIELYAFAQELFQAQLRSAGDSFEPELRRFQRINSIGGRVYEYCESLVQNFQRIGRRERSVSAGGLSQPPGGSTL